MKQTKVYIYGRHAVAEALLHMPQIVRKIFVATTMDDKKLRALIQKSDILTERLDPRRVTSFVEGNAPHQGIVALIFAESLLVPFESFIESLSVTPDTLIVLMHGINDPHNVGAIIRSAAAFGASAVLMPVKNQAPVSASVVKASAGMVFRTPLITVADIPAAILALKEKGVRIYGMAGDAKHSLMDETFRAPTLVIVGNEGEGIPQKTRALCDLILKIPMNPRAESLNVAASAAVALYAWSLRHGKALK